MRYVMAQKSDEVRKTIKKEAGGPSHKREEPPAHIKRHLISLTCGLPIRNATSVQTKWS